MLASTLLVSLALCIFLNDQVQMPWWGLVFASAMAFFFTLPISIITATTNQVSNIDQLTNPYGKGFFVFYVIFVTRFADTGVEYNNGVCNGNHLPGTTNR